MDWMEFAVSILAGLAAAIPLVVKLVEYVQKATKEKNWNKMLDLIVDLMEEAETLFADGAQKKEWVLAMVQASANSINYDVDLVAVGNMIDELCDMTKVVNAPETNTQEVGE